MDYPIYVRGGKETAQVIKALQRATLITYNNIIDGSNENRAYYVRKGDPQEKKLRLSDIIYSNYLKGTGCTEVTPAQFYKTISGREWVSGELTKANIYCFGGQIFKKILTELVCNNICRVSDQIIKLTVDSDTVWGYSQVFNTGKTIGYSRNLKCFSDRGYHLVTPEEFYKIWSGKDWNYKESVKSEKKYIGFKGSIDIDTSLLPKNIKNPARLLCYLPNATYYIKDNILCIVHKDEEKELLEKIVVLDWPNFLAAVTTSTHETHIVPEQVKTPILPGACIPQPSILETESPDDNKFILSKKQTLKIVL